MRPVEEEVVGAPWTADTERVDPNTGLLQPVQGESINLNINPKIGFSELKQNTLQINQPILSPLKQISNKKRIQNELCRSIHIPIVSAREESPLLRSSVSPGFIVKDGELKVFGDLT